MEYEFKIKINVDSIGVFGFKDKKEVQEFIREELTKFACVNSVHVLSK